MNRTDESNGEADPPPARGETAPCKENPAYCFNAGPFVARLIQVTDGAQGNYSVVRLNVQFESVTKETLALAYRAHTSILVDEFQNTYFCCAAKGALDTSATGIGINQDDAKETDSHFRLEAGQTGSVTFQVWGHRARSQDSPYFHYDVTIDEMDPNNPRRVQKQHAIYFGDFAATWHFSHPKPEVHEKH